MQRPPPTIYLAARYGRWPEMQQIAARLSAHGARVTSRWILGDHELRSGGQAETPHFSALWAQEDIHDLLDAEIVLSFTEAPGDVPGRSRGGRHAEFGMALVVGKTCIVIGYREHVFHWLPSVDFYPTFEEAFEALLRDWHGTCPNPFFALDDAPLDVPRATCCTHPLAHHAATPHSGTRRPCAALGCPCTDLVLGWQGTEETTP